MTATKKNKKHCILRGVAIELFLKMKFLFLWIFTMTPFFKNKNCFNKHILNRAYRIPEHILIFTHKKKKRNNRIKFKNLYPASWRWCHSKPNASIILFVWWSYGVHFHYQFFIVFKVQTTTVFFLRVKFLVFVILHLIQSHIIRCHLMPLCKDNIVWLASKKN